MTTRPSPYVALGLIDAIVNGAGDLDARTRLEEAADVLLDRFTADERNLAAVELAAFMEVLP